MIHVVIASMYIRNQIITPYAEVQICKKIFLVIEEFYNALYILNDLKVQ